MNPPTVALHLNCLAPNRYARSAVDVAIDQAVVRTLRADDAAFARLPVPVRFRASGAIQAWTAARRAAGREGERLTASLADPHIPPLHLFNPMADFVQRHSTIDFETPDGRVVALHGSNSVYWQAFWQRAGALYEPTPALHRMLDATDVANNVPLRLLRLPTPALCIVPDPSTWSVQGGIQAVAVFSHAPMGEDKAGRCLTFVACSQWTDPQPFNGVEVLTVPADDEDVPIGESLERAMLRPPLFPQADGLFNPPQDECRRRWLDTLNYVVKMLLYLSLDGSRVIHERPFSTAGGCFPGWASASASCAWRRSINCMTATWWGRWCWLTSARRSHTGWPGMAHVHIGVGGTSDCSRTGRSLRCAR
jgi:hypothetical protein